MLMVLLYGIATFAETGIGIWMFGKMFPRRESVSNSLVARIILWTLLILTTYTMQMLRCINMGFFLELMRKQ